MLTIRRNHSLMTNGTSNLTAILSKEKHFLTGIK